MEKSESQKFRENLEHFKNLKLITQEVYEQLMEKDKAFENAKNNTKMYKAWLCINPPPGSYTLEELYSFTIQHIPYKNYLLCVEQNTDNGVRPHVHILASVTKTTRPNAEIARLAKMFKVKENFIECKISNNGLLNTQREKYVRGEKQDSKKDNVEKDKNDRLKLKIPDFHIQ